MELKHIKTTACPVCGNGVVEREDIQCDNGKPRLHCNGGQWESRRFACGLSVTYVPNFPNTEGREGECRNNEVFLIKQNKRKEAIEKMNAFLLSLDVDDDFKECAIKTIIVYLKMY